MLRNPPGIGSKGKSYEVMGLELGLATFNTSALFTLAQFIRPLTFKFEGD